MGVVASAKPLILTRFPAQQRIANRDQEMLVIDLDDVAQVRVPHDVRSVTSITYICTPFYSIAPHLDSYRRHVARRNPVQHQALSEFVL